MVEAPQADRGYTEADLERWLPEQHSSRRSDFARDRARLLHSGALRRLAAKTQVLSPTVGLDFARTRLTHSLEVAQVGRELAGSLGLAADVVDTACLAHDLGHPPFGHNGERALNEWSASIGGFEGNAQSLRLLTRLEPKVFGDDGRPYGLNLTRASLDASVKYPWGLDAPVGDPSGRAKFGFYPEDEAAFRWLRSGAPERRPCIEAQVMDLSDDIAYSVHDFEDAVVAGSVDVAALRSNAAQRDVVGAMHAWVGGAFDQDELVEALHRLRATDAWIVEWDGSRRAHGALKNLTSQLIGRFAGAATAATRRAHPAGELVRFQADVHVPRGIQAEIAALKGIVAAFVMANDVRRPVYVQQRELLQQLADALLAAPQHLDTAFAADWAAADDDRQRHRVIVDQVASLTDQSALAWHGRLVR
ncbi:deoxyguanosinetriphosphate triphosphohydrolase [Amnibacterium endophyticum]|uniref:Deoxyguanosinetriphosphate triphosphohydrolase-like protein n=1 Tax=Amnibacterium endophyticum TaxID=2109337 RepID=A0ABW4LG62_9MICO